MRINNIANYNVYQNQNYKLNSPQNKINSQPAFQAKFDESDVADVAYNAGLDGFEAKTFLNMNKRIQNYGLPQTNIKIEKDPEDNEVFYKCSNNLLPNTSTLNNIQDIVLYDGTTEEGYGDEVSPVVKFTAMKMVLDDIVNYAELALILKYAQQNNMQPIEVLYNVLEDKIPSQDFDRLNKLIKKAQETASAEIIEEEENYIDNTLERILDIYAPNAKIQEPDSDDED